MNRLVLIASVKVAVHDEISVQIVENDYKNIHHSTFEYFNDKCWLSDPLKSMVIFILLKMGMVNFLKN